MNTLTGVKLVRHWGFYRDWATVLISDDFAPRFTDKYHVYGLTTRGFGYSASPVAQNYDLITLANDVKGLLDTLHCSRAILAEHYHTKRSESGVLCHKIRLFIFLDCNLKSPEIF